MAGAFVQNLANTVSKTPGATTVITIVTGHTPAQGNLVVVRATSMDASGVHISSIADSKSNTWVVGPIISAGQLNTAASGKGIAIAVSKLTSALAVSDTITITWDATASVAVACVADEFSGVDAVPDANDPGNNHTGSGSSTTPGLGASPQTPSATSVLVIAILTTNGPSGDTYTEDGSAPSDGDTWHSLTRVGTTGAGATSNVTCAGAYKLTTSNGSAITWAPTITSRGWAAGADFFQITATGVFLPHSTLYPQILPNQSPV